MKKTTSNSNEITKDSKEKTKDVTLFFTKRIGYDLVISNFHSKSVSISVFSNNREYTNTFGNYRLAIGDSVFVSSQKVNYITFAHYKIVSLARINHAELVYSCRLYHPKKINQLKNDYRSFVKDFLSRHDSRLKHFS